MAAAVASSTTTKRVIRPKKKTENNNVSCLAMDTSAVADAAAGHVAGHVAADAAAGAGDVNTRTQSTSPYCDPSLFVKRTIKRNLTIPFYKLKYGIDVKELLTNELALQIEGRCSVEGYICPKSIVIQSHSCGRLAGANIIFDIIADCLICFPDEHAVIQCVVKTITQAGIRAGATQLKPGDLSPIEVFLSRDMNIKNSGLFSRIEENDILTVEVIGRRFVLHDTHVTVIAMLMDAVSSSDVSMNI